MNRTISKVPAPRSASSISTIRMVGCALLAFALLAGCKSKSETADEPKNEPVAEEPTPPAPPEPAPAPAATTTMEESHPKTVVDGVPTVEDYEDEAEQVITKDNLESELDRLEQEIKSD